MRGELIKLNYNHPPGGIVYEQLCSVVYSEEAPFLATLVQPGIVARSTVEALLSDLLMCLRVTDIKCTVEESCTVIASSCLAVKFHVSSRELVIDSLDRDLSAYCVSFVLSKLSRIGA